MTTAHSNNQMIQSFQLFLATERHPVPDTASCRQESMEALVYAAHATFASWVFETVWTPSGPTVSVTIPPHDGDRRNARWASQSSIRCEKSIAMTKNTQKAAMPAHPGSSAPGESRERGGTGEERGRNGGGGAHRFST